MVVKVPPYCLRNQAIIPDSLQLTSCISDNACSVWLLSCCLARQVTFPAIWLIFMMNKTKKQIVYESILQLIRKSEAQKGDKLISETKLVKQLSISRGIVRQATEQLIDEAMIYRVRGSGIYMGSQKLYTQTMYKSLSSFDEKAREKNMEARRKVIFIELKPADKDLASDLKIREGVYIYHIKRLMCFNETPIILEDFYMPTTLFPHIEVSKIEQSKYQYVEMHTGRKVTESIQNFKPVIVDDPEINKLMNIDNKTPMIQLKEVSSLSDGVVFEVNTSIMNTNYMEITQIAKR